MEKHVGRGLGVGGIPELAALQCCQKEISVKLQISQGFGSLNRDFYFPFQHT